MDKDTVLRLAETSKLAVSDAEAEVFAEEISSVLEMIDRIKDFKAHGLFTTDNAVEFDELRHDSTEEDADMAEKIREERKGSFTAPKVV